MWMLTKYLAILTVAFCFVIGENSLAQSKRRAQQVRVPQPAPTNVQPKGPEDQRGTEQSPVIVKIAPTPKTDEERAEEAKERERIAEIERKKEKSDADLVKYTADLAKYTAELARFTKRLFYATGALVFATLGLVAFAFFQSRDTKAAVHAAKRSADIAERALTELERPFIGLKIIDPGLAETAEGVDATALRFCFTNYGRTPATITQLADSFSLQMPSHRPQPYDIATAQNEFPLHGVIVGANNSETPNSHRSYSDPDCIPTIDLPRITFGTDDLFFYGFIRYRDIFNNRYRMGFCLVWTADDGTGRFLFDGNDGYNYTCNE